MSLPAAMAMSALSSAAAHDACPKVTVNKINACMCDTGSETLLPVFSMKSTGSTMAGPATTLTRSQPCPLQRRPRQSCDLWRVAQELKRVFQNLNPGKNGRARPGIANKYDGEAADLAGFREPQRAKDSINRNIRHTSLKKLLKWCWSAMKRGSKLHLTNYTTSQGLLYTVHPLFMAEATAAHPNSDRRQHRDLYTTSSDRKKHPAVSTCSPAAKGLRRVARWQDEGVAQRGMHGAGACGVDELNKREAVGPITTSPLHAAAQAQLSLLKRKVPGGCTGITGGGGLAQVDDDFNFELLFSTYFEL